MLQKCLGSCDLGSLVGFRFSFNNNSLESSWTEDSFEINVLLESSSAAEAAPSFGAGAQNEEIEAELFSRIRDLEAQQAHGLPPQLNAGDYERLVRENLANSVSVNHYRERLFQELFDVKIMLLKSELQDMLVNTMVAEPRIDVILNLSPFQDIRSEAYDFIEQKVEPVSSMRHEFERNILEASLKHFIQDIEQNGPQSLIFREFYSHFTDEEFRRLRDP